MGLKILEWHVTPGFPYSVGSTTKGQMDEMARIRDEFCRALESAGSSFRTPIIGPICECGKENHGFANHSDWCDIYKLENRK